MKITILCQGNEFETIEFPETIIDDVYDSIEKSVAFKFKLKNNSTLVMTKGMIDRSVFIFK